MSYTPEVIEKATREIRRRNAAAEEEFRRRKLEIQIKSPEYVMLEQKLIEGAKRIVTVAGLKDKDEIRKKMNILRDENLALQGRIRQIIKECGYPGDFLDMHYTCEKCRDTGNDGGKVCDCFKSLLRKYAFDELSASSPLRLCSFDDFSLKYYKGADRERMTDIYTYCREYADNFDLKNPNILLYGQTGLGKTHISLSIAGEVIKKGYNVLYNSCQNFFSQIENEHFGRSDGKTEQLLLDADLLIMDDLGAEFASPFTVSLLYNIVNTRLLHGLPTIISTNLSLSELEKKFSPRIASRILGEYEHLYFSGSDIRQIKKNEE